MNIFIINIIKIDGNGPNHKVYFTNLPTREDMLATIKTDKQTINNVYNNNIKNSINEFIWPITWQPNTYETSNKVLGTHIVITKINVTSNG